MSQRTRARTAGAAPLHTKAVVADESATATPSPAKRGRRKSVAEPMTPAVEPVEAPGAAGASEPSIAAMSPDALARALRAVAAELERDPALARRVASAMSGAAEDEREIRQPALSAEAVEDVGEGPAATIGRTFHPSLITGVSPDLGPGALDPFALRERLGMDGLRDALESLRLGSLRAIIRQHTLDPGGRLSKLNDAAKLRERILQAAMEQQ